MIPGTPEDRYEMLAAAPAGELEVLADRILAEAHATGTPVTVLHGPEVGLGTLRLPVPGTVGSDVVTGHVAFTTCEVRLGGHRGDGCRAGRDLPAAVAAAVCDAEADRGGPLAGDVQALCDIARQRLLAVSRERAAAVALTRMEAGA